MNNGPTSSVTTTIDFSLAPEEHYVQFVPPSKFGVTYNSATREVHLVRADGKRGPLHGRADKIYTLRGFIGLMQRENLAMALGWRIEDEIIRNLLASFESWHDLRDAVQKFCPFPESARLIATEWAAQVFALDADVGQNGGHERDMYDAAQDTGVLPSRILPNAINSGVDSYPISNLSEANRSRYNLSVQHASSMSVKAEATSPQEVVEKTLPVPVHARVDDRLVYTTFHPTLPAQIIPSDYFKSMATSSPKPPFQHDAVQTLGQAYPESAPESFYDVSGTSHGMAATHQAAGEESTLPIRFNNFPINPFFPPLNPAAPSPHKRRRTDPLIEHGESSGSGDTLPRHDIFAEIEVLASLEVLTTREITVSRKFAMVAKVLPNFGLPWTDTIVTRCYAAIDVAIKNCVSRMQTYFLMEDFGNCHCYERLLNHMMDANETTRRCDSCDSCIAIFIHHLRLGDIVDVAATLRNCTLRDAIVQFHRNGVQLGAKAAWDDDFRQKEFEKMFYSLDLITAHLRFPRKFISSNEEGDWEARKRRKST